MIMKNIYKSKLATIVLLLCSLVANAHDFEVDGIYYNVTSDTEVGVTFYGEYSHPVNDVYYGAIVIPETVTYNDKTYRVTSIGTWAFQNCSHLTSITIPTSVVSIGTDVFESTAWYQNQPDGLIYAGNVLYGWKGSMPANTTIDVREGTVSIRDEAFRYLGGAGWNSRIIAVNIPESVIEIGNKAFYNCGNLTSINLSNKTISIGNQAFHSTAWYNNQANGLVYIDDIVYCYKGTMPDNTTINIKEGTIGIANYAFSDYKTLSSITIPEGLAMIGDYAFSGCSSLTSVTIPESVSSIGSCAFQNCSSLASINIPQSVTTISDYVFYGCSNLASIAVPDGITSIGRGAFRDCSFTSINIPQGVTNIGVNAFYNCTNLEAVHIDDLSAWFNIEFGDHWANPLYYATGLYLNDEIVTELIIPNNVTAIKEYTFYESSHFSSITIPESVTSIAIGAFNRCTVNKLVVNCNIPSGIEGIGSKYGVFTGVNAGEVIIGSKATTIGSYAFSGCGNLTSVTISEGVASIGKEAFRGCGITSIAIPKSVMSIGDYAFSGCSITSVSIPEGATSVGDNVFRSCDKLTTADLKGVTSIGGEAFYGCSSLTSIELGDGLTLIGRQAFNLCDNLTEVKIHSIEAWCNIRYSDIGSVPLIHAHNLYLNGELVTEVIIPNTVTEIKDYAFYGCSNLSSVTIPESVTSVGDAAFAGTAWYTNQPDGLIYAGKALYQYKGTGTMPENTSITIKEGTTSICRGAFASCIGLSSIILPNSVTSIGAYAFSGCSNLASINIPKSINSIGAAAFKNCSKLNKMTIPNSITEIQSETFAGCSSLTSMDIPNNICFIGDKAFYNCTELSDVNIANSVTEIGEEAFSGTAWYEEKPDGVIYMGGLVCGYKGTMPENTIIEIKEGATRIEDKAFSGCSGLTGIVIPSSVTSIGKDVFLNSNNLSSIVVAEGNTVYDSRDNCNAIIETDSNTLLFGCSATVIPESVTSIGAYAFYHCSTLTSINIPNNVVRIGKFAFYNCNKMNMLTIGSSVTTIEDYAFEYCDHLNKVVNYSNLKMFKGSEEYGDIGNADIVLNVSILDVFDDYQFYTTDDAHYLANYVGSNTSIVLPDNYKGESYRIDNYAFYYCNNLTSITISKGVTQIGEHALSSCNSLTSIIVDKGNTTYDSRNNCNAIIETKSNKLIKGFNTSTIPDGVTSIKNNAFEYCRELQTITIPNSVNEIGDYAFQYCSGLTSVNLSNTIKRIGYETFSNCKNLTSITIPESVIEIEYGAFRGCNSLTSFHVPESVTLIEEGLFLGCQNLATITVAEGNTVYDSRNECNAIINTANNRLIVGCSSTVIPDSIISIGMGAFNANKGLTNISIPAKMSRIDAHAFDACNNLEYIISYAITPPVCGNYTFSGVDKTIPVYVPESSISAYQSANHWKDFSSIHSIAEVKIEHPIYEPIIPINTAMYNLQGKRIADTEALGKGIYIVDGKKVMVR